MRAFYTPENWYWTVADDAARVWSSARAGWVDVNDQSYVAWLALPGTGPTPIASLAELAEVLRLVFPAGMLSTYAAYKRYEVEVGGVVANGARVATDRESQSMIAGAFNFVAVNPDVVIDYKTSTGFVSLNGDAIRAVAIAVGGHVQACFSKEAQVSAQITAGTVTSIADIDAAFATIASN